MVNVEKIKNLCKEKGISLYSLEKYLGMGNGTIGKWGLPNRKPNFDNVIAVANALEVPLSELVSTEKEETSDVSFGLKGTETKGFPILVDRIRELCNQQGKTLFSLEKECGFGNGTINKWDKNSPSVSRVIIVAEKLNTTVSYLIGETDKKGPISENQDGAEKELMVQFRMLPEDLQVLMLAQIKAVLIQRGLLPAQPDLPDFDQDKNQ